MGRMNPMQESGLQPILPLRYHSHPMATPTPCPLPTSLPTAYGGPQQKSSATQSPQPLSIHSCLFSLRGHFSEARAGTSISFSCSKAWLQILLWAPRHSTYSCLPPAPFV